MAGYKLRSQDKFNFFNNIFMFILLFIFAYPFWYILVISFNDGADALKGGIYWWPRVFTFDNFAYLFKTGEVANAYVISIARTVLGTFLGLMFTSVVTFGLSRKELPGRRVFTFIFLFTMYFGGGLIPYYLMLRDIHLLNNFLVYIIPGMFSVFNMIILRTSFRNIPESLIESAKIDGVGYYGILFRIVLPLSMPILAALTLFTAVWHWNDWFSGAFFVSNQKLLPIQTYLQRMINSAVLSFNGLSDLSYASASDKVMKHMVTPISVRTAILIVVIAPIMMVYPFLQKYFIHGVMIGSLKE